MPPSVRYHCPCLSNSPFPPPPHLQSSYYSFHPLHELFFCEECDAVRCNRCVTVEVSSYYCPNCLFEVPSASVRAEKNRCARNCFLCPNCRNTLSVVPSDPPDSGDGRLTVPISSLNEPPFFLYCNHCRWDSAEVGITFEKPTGLAAQLQKFEDSAPDSLEFERLKEHFEPFIRASSLSSSTNPSHPTAHPSSAAHSHHAHSNSITAAASAALARDVPGVSKYNPLSRSTSSRSATGKDRSVNKDEMPEYRSRLEISKASASGTGGGEADVEFMQHLEDIGQVATLEQRWFNSWATPLQTSELKPLRIPLHSKRSKRCPACTHILIKPEQKAQSVRYKIKLVAANYLPAITVALPHAQRLTAELARKLVGKTTSATADDERSSASDMHAGKTYPFHLALSNPLYDPITVRLSVQRMHVSTAPTTKDDGSPEKARRPPFAVSLPTSSFSVAAFAEAWEYEDDEDMFGADDGDDLPGRGGKETDSRGKVRTVGVLEKRANVTLVGGEVVIGKEARGNVKFNMLVSYTYRSDDPSPEGNDTEESSKTTPEVKTFAFYTVVDLGQIIPREEPKADSDI
ncbi:dynactin p62 family-domain-containing protein [Gymnopilus junonius]|uniref:Dynactin subunit 4 n=1 Tax=Gymnopilus junonius TaxID=109634 RepID=A0A9P5NZ30_GYMJU|nr:dynactin p62 family-domain-containing protein [Gymnopilus junonius]